ncbi:Di-trans-poly-cis-decaprenylcistransferase-like protein [Corchorus capsularis]|uniref:Alkyl transferase n=1 Tax=Corchorus capsularis TaxID=210143 RepID=A0A1R3K837_COCAP|nr:Di-trans-poly-cis-decaprenylcistransferase-like protein [Corchorus capsularis]
MEKDGVSKSARVLWKLSCFFRKFIVSTLSVGPIPAHVAFIMDGNRRYAKQRNLEEGEGHNAGYLALKFMVYYCLELGIKHVTAYAFSIDNFKRSPEGVQRIMDLMVEKIEEELSQVDNTYSKMGIRIHFSGNLELLSQPTKDAVKRLMAATAKNSKVLLTICFAYTSTNEIVHAIEQTCQEKMADQMELEEPNVVKLADIEKHMYMAVAPDPDIIIRTSGESRLSNFLLWQSANCSLICFSQLWPAISFWHLLWAVLKFQRNYYYFEKKKKQI